MEWSYGVTTVPERIGNGLLQQTLESLKLAGFPSPHIFIDGQGEVPGYEVTCRTSKVRAYGNWMLAAWELYVRCPSADRYAVFQDDLVTYRNLRQYLEQAPYPEKGYLNLYTFRQNEKAKRGWYESNQLGKGAVALVFSNEALRTLLAQQYIVDRPLNPNRGHKAIDGGIVSAYKLVGWKEYVHNPSLVQHTGDVSAIGNSKHEKAPSFRGEDFDATVLLKENGMLPDPEKFRIGIVGHSNDPVTRELIENTDICLWLVKPSGNILRTETFDKVDTIFCPHGHPEKIKQFLKDIDVVVISDESQRHEQLLPMAKEQYKRIIGVTKSTEPLDWMNAVDLLLCTTLDSYNALASKYPCVEFSWPSKWHTGADREFNLLARTGEHRIAVLS